MIDLIFNIIVFIVFLVQAAIVGYFGLIFFIFIDTIFGFDKKLKESKFYNKYGLYIYILILEIVYWYLFYKFDLFGAIFSIYPEEAFNNGIKESLGNFNL